MVFIYSKDNFFLLLLKYFTINCFNGQDAELQYRFIALKYKFSKLIIKFFPLKSIYLLHLNKVFFLLKLAKLLQNVIYQLIYCIV